jgi:NAD(P)H-hydrate epimerase
LISLVPSQLPAVTADEMREVDRLMVEEYGVQIEQMMENAGRSLANLVREILGDMVRDKKILIAAGKGNNGGGGMVAARHLHNWGADVTLILNNTHVKGVPGTQMNIIKNFGIEIKTGEKVIKYLRKFKGEAVLDSLIGYGLSGAPREWTAEVIKALNSIQTPVISLDVPSASVTMTVALPKVGLIKPNADVVGDLYLADIGVPNRLYKEIGIEIPLIFNTNEIIRLDYV